MVFETLEFKKDGSIGYLTINRPKALNALNAQMIKELFECLSGLRQDKELRALIVTGAGDKAFVAGADIKEMSERDPSTGKAMAQEGQKVFQLLEDLPFASIACVNGFALGGGLELAMSCDFIVASKGVKMGLPEVSLGLLPGYGGTQRLSRYVGKSIARMITLTGDMYTSEQMENWGLVAITVEASELLSTCEKLAKKISTRSPKAIHLAKRAINEGYDESQVEGLKHEAQFFHEVFNSQDKIEGVKAFIEKRNPQFTGQ